MSMLTPAAPATFVRGAPLTPAAELLRWLEVQGERLVRIPVLLARGAVGWSTAEARIGSADDALTIFLDDTRLGIGLADRARHACGTAATCALWLAGRWAGERNGCSTFEVFEVGPMISAAALPAVTHAEVAGEDAHRP